MSNQTAVEAHNYSESWLPLKRDCDDPYLNFERIRMVWPDGSGITYQDKISHDLAMLDHNLLGLPKPSPL